MALWPHENYLCALRARPSWDWLFSWLLFGQTLSCRDPMHPSFTTQLGRRPTGRQTLPALDAKCSFGHSKNADDTFVSLWVENF